MWETAYFVHKLSCRGQELSDIYQQKSSTTCAFVSCKEPWGWREGTAVVEANTRVS